MRQIKTHEVEGLNEALVIQALDNPGQGNACHEYKIEPSDPSRSFACCFVTFQNGPIAEFGVNGISNESLLAIVRDRLEGFQSGAFACAENQIALENVIAAMDSLASRTRQRIDRGVEGTNQQ
jgi:hypothetical protein